MSLNSISFIEKVNDIKKFICNKPDAIPFLDEITNTDIIQAHTHINKYDAVSRKELAYLVGLLLKKESLANNLTPLSPSCKKDTRHLRKILKDLHSEFFKDRNIDLKNYEYFTSESLVETTFYEESGFYNDQPLMLSNSLYKSSKKWIIKNKQFKLESLLCFYFAVCEILSKKRERYIKNGDRYSVDDIFFTVDDVANLKSDFLRKKAIPSREEAANIIKSFSCKPGDQFNSFSRPGDENILTYYPIIEIKDGIYWLPLPDMLAIAFYLSPLHWMREDKSYKNTANKNIGKDLEELCGDMLKRSFDRVYVTVNIYKGKNRYTDIDGLAILGNVAIVIQAKNKRMMPETLSGNIESFKRDFNMVAQRAYDQGEKSSYALLNQNSFSFKDSNDKLIKMPNISQVFILCISSSVYYAGAMQVNEYLQQKHPDTKLPIVLSIFDFDLLTRYLTNPYEFVYYLNLRIEKYKKIVSNNEVTPLSTYLFTDYMHDARSDYVLLMDDLISKLDEDYKKNQWGRDPKIEKQFSIRYKDATGFTRLLDSVYRTNEPGKERVINKLLSLPIEAAIQLSGKIAQHNLTVLSPNNCGFSGVFDDFGISYFNSSFIDAKTLIMKMIKNAETYGKHSWIGFLRDTKTQSIKFLYIEQ